MRIARIGTKDSTPGFAVERDGGGWLPLSAIARGITLEPGDVILTGTPHGVGFAMDPPRYLTPGDVVECEVEDLGRLRNPVVGPTGA